MELDYLKKTWDSTTGVGGSFKSDMMIDLTRKTSLDRLLGNYRRFAYISFGMTVFSLLFLSNRLFPQSAGIWITLYLMAYFLTTGLIDSWLYRRLKGIDVCRMSVREVALTAIECRKRHHQCMFVLIPFAIGILYLLLFVGYEDLESAKIGAIVGGIIGGAVGIKKYLEMMKDYRILSKTDWTDDALD